MPALRCGADRLGEYKHLFKDARVGLVTTPTGRTSDGRSTLAALQQAADLRVLLGPEHGVRGDGAARRWSALDRWGTFLVLVKSELTALRRDGRGLRLSFEKKRWFA